MLRGGKFKAGFTGGFFGHMAKGLGAKFGFGKAGTGGLRDYAGRTAVASVVGGTISKAVGGKFSNGAVSAAFTHMFNAEGGRMGNSRRIAENRQRKLLSGAQDGHLTKAEADAWYKDGGGVTIMADASKMTLLKLGGRYVSLTQYAVYGQLAVDANGSLYPDPYDFEQNGSGFFDDGYLGARNAATWIGGAMVGGGQQFNIEFYNKPVIIDPSKNIYIPYHRP